jgi:parvulin-like peptidyl-prolyl isomerase
LNYPEGFAKNLIRFTDVNGRLSSALPFETEEKYYLIRMTKTEAIDIIEDDDDYDDDGMLLDEVRDEYADKYDDEIEEADIDLDEIADEDAEDDED